MCMHYQKVACVHALSEGSMCAMHYQKAACVRCIIRRQHVCDASVRLWACGGLTRWMFWADSTIASMQVHITASMSWKEGVGSNSAPRKTSF